MEDKDITQKIEFSVDKLKEKISKAFGCSDWDDLVKNSSRGFVEGAREYIAEKYFKDDPEGDIIVIDNRFYCNKSVFS
jgi:predicted secreted acid phosphatase